jgi:integrase
MEIRTFAETDCDALRGLFGRAGEGANIKTVSKMLGHSSVKITLDVYGHLMPGMQADTLGHLDGVFS